MKSAFDRLNLRPFERRLVVIVGTVVFVVLNVVFVWPYFHARGKALGDLAGARKLLDTFQAEARQTPDIERKVREMEKEGEPVPQEDQQLQFLRTVQLQAAQSGVNITGNSRPETRTNQFFLEQSQTFTVVSGEAQLVDFLYTLGTGASMIRVRGLSLRPDGPRQQLAGTVKLVASYQRKPPVKPPSPPPTAAVKTNQPPEKPAPPQTPAAARTARPPEKTAPKAPGKPDAAAAKAGKAPVQPNRPAGQLDAAGRPSPVPPPGPGPGADKPTDKTK